MGVREAIQELEVREKLLAAVAARGCDCETPSENRELHLADCPYPHAKVIPFRVIEGGKTTPERQAEIVGCLEELLELARAGLVDGLGLIWEAPDMTPSFFWAVDDRHRLLGLLRRFDGCVLDELCAEELEDDGPDGGGGEPLARPG